MQLSDVQPSILDLPNEQVIEIHQRTRRNRRTPMEKSKRKTKTTTTKTKRERKSMQEIKKDPEKMRELLDLLED